MATTKKAAPDGAAAAFTRAQVLQSKKYRAVRDVLAVSLKDGRQYTADEIQKIKDEFLQRPIQEKINGKGDE